MPPTSEENVIDPVPALRDKLLPPLTVPERIIFPAPAPVLSVEVPVKPIALAKERFALEVVIVPLRFTEPPPLWANEPAELIVPPIVYVLLLVIATAPVPAVDKELL